jgi:hypothetical protein
MTFYLVQVFNKIYKCWEVKEIENKCVQTDTRLTTDNKSSQTDVIIKPSLVDNSTQTDIKSSDINYDNEWANLTWINADTIDMI